jgi:hypothetical protein
MRRNLNSSTFCIDCRVAVPNNIKCFYGRKDIMMSLDKMIWVRDKHCHRHYAVSVSLNSRLKSIAIGHLLRIATILLQYLNTIAKDWRPTIISRGSPAYTHNGVFIGDSH